MIEHLLALAFVTALPLGLGLVSELLSVFSRPAVTRCAWVAGAAAAIGLEVPRGSGLAGVLAIPWVAVVAIVAAAGFIGFVRAVRLREQGDLLRRVGGGVAIAFVAVGCGWLAFDRLGVQPLGFSPTIVLLTATHFHVAGLVLTLAGALLAARGRRSAAVATAALTIGMPLTAAGFLGAPFVGWVGSILVASAGIAIGWGSIRQAGDELDAIRRNLLRLAGATLFVTMPMAAAYASGTTFGIAFLDIPVMAAIHGSLNVVGFAIPAMLAWSRDIR
jgi:hypothetical protein